MKHDQRTRMPHAYLIPLNLPRPVTVETAAGGAPCLVVLAGDGWRLHR